uniref:ShKT domain-containing protein n=1 Tax=Strongyloides papillosus TaxID=174720 RepID=A0A0N5B6K3_STREA
MILFYYLIFILLNKLYGDLIDFSYGPCVGGQCIESTNKSFTYICHSDDNCYPDYIFQLDKFYSSGPCISSICPPSTFCYIDNLCYYETLQICSKQEECPNGYECKDSVCKSLFSKDNELFNVEFPEKFLKHFHKNEIISSCYNTQCPENYICADKFKFPMCLPKHQVEYYLHFHCNDTLIINGKNACLKYKNLCNETVYGKIMREKCSKTCNTCLSFGSTKYYNDLISKKGIEICKKYKYLCNDYLYHDIMKNICPTTCGKKRIILPPIK